MKTLVIANPAARAGKVGRYWHRIERGLTHVLGEVRVYFTSGPGDATAAARQGILEGVERIAAVGGDGTLNEVVNGFVHGEDERFIGKDVTLALIPVGTGGDFSRSIGLSGVDFEVVLQHATERRIDIGRAEMVKHNGAPLVRHFINISSFGSSGLIVDMVNHTTKIFGAKSSFLWGTIKGLATFKNRRIRLRVDDVERELVINDVAVANGRYFGGSMKVAPYAVLDDGLFEVVVIGDVGLAKFAAASRKLYAGEHMGDPFIERFVGKEVVATPLEAAPVLVDLDGEQPGKLPVRYTLLPGAIKLLAPWDRAEAGSRPSPPQHQAAQHK